MTAPDPSAGKGAEKTDDTSNKDSVKVSLEDVLKALMVKLGFHHTFDELVQDAKNQGQM